MAERRLRFTAFVGVKDEADFLPLSIEQLRAVGVSTIVVLDFGSTDGTLEYLREAEAAGDLWVVHRDDAPAGIARPAAVALARASDADFVLFLDADELLLPRTGKLHDCADLEAADVISIMRYNVVATERGPELPGKLGLDTYDRLLLYAQPIPDFYRHALREPDTPWIRGVLEPKMMLRPRSLVAIHPGYHDADLTSDRPWRRVVATDMVIAHVPIRGRERFAVRAANYRAAIERRPESYAGYQGWQWVRFARAADEGRADEEFHHQLIDGDELGRLRATLVVRSAREVLETPIPAITSEAQYRSMVGRAEPWLWAAGLVCRTEGLPPGGKLEILDGQTRTPAVFVPPDAVVKFHPPGADGHAIAVHEAATLRRLAAAPRPEGSTRLQVPRLVGEGTLEAGYRYVVMSRVPGTPLRQLEAMDGLAERDAIPTAVGDFLRWLHAIPLDDAERRAAWPGFVVRVAALRAGAVDLNRERGVPDHLLAELDAWLPSVDELAGTPSSAVLVHGALDDSNLLGWLDERRFVPTGVIDVARALVGHPFAELGPIAWDLLRADMHATASCLRAAGLIDPDAPDAARLALAWVLLAPSATAPEPAVFDDVSDLDELADRWFASRVPVSSLAGADP